MSSKGKDGTVRPTNRANTQVPITMAVVQQSRCDQSPVSQAQTVNP